MGGDLFHFFKQLAVILFVGDVLAGESRRNDAGAHIQPEDFEACIIGESRNACLAECLTRFLERVRLECVAIFDNVGRIGKFRDVSHRTLKAFKKSRDFQYLPLIARSKND
jgi:hypothetical protein